MDGTWRRRHRWRMHTVLHRLASMPWQESHSISRIQQVLPLIQRIRMAILRIRIRNWKHSRCSCIEKRMNIHSYFNNISNDCEEAFYSIIYAYSICHSHFLCLCDGKSRECITNHMFRFMSANDYVIYVGNGLVYIMIWMGAKWHNIFYVYRTSSCGDLRLIIDGWIPYHSLRICYVCIYFNTWIHVSSSSASFTPYHPFHYSIIFTGLLMYHINGDIFLSEILLIGNFGLYYLCLHFMES